MKMDRSPPLSQDAALVTALAGTAMPFSHSAEEQAERWLRALRVHGEVGSVLQSLGVGEAPLMSEAGDSAPTSTPVPAGDVVDRVVDRARELALARAADAVGTADLLVAVLDEYGPLMDRALYLRGSSREELIGRLAETAEATGLR